MNFWHDFCTFFCPFCPAVQREMMKAPKFCFWQLQQHVFFLKVLKRWQETHFIWSLQSQEHSPCQNAQNFDCFRKGLAGKGLTEKCRKEKKNSVGTNPAFASLLGAKAISLARFSEKVFPSVNPYTAKGHVSGFMDFLHVFDHKSVQNQDRDMQPPPF